MRTTITIFAIGGLVTFGLSTASAQGLKRPVNAPPEAEISLGELARQVNPGASTGTTRVYTNADLRVRPAPVAPVTPPFPEIAPSRGILEHPGLPEVEPTTQQMPEMYLGGVPYWDGFFGFDGFNFDRSKRRRQVPTPATHLGISGRFSAPSSASDILLGPLVQRPNRVFQRGGGSHGRGR